MNRTISVLSMAAILAASSLNGGVLFDFGTSPDNNLPQNSKLNDLSYALGNATYTLTEQADTFTLDIVRNNTFGGAAYFANGMGLAPGFINPTANDYLGVEMALTTAPVSGDINRISIGFMTSDINPELAGTQKRVSWFDLPYLQIPANGVPGMVQMTTPMTSPSRVDGTNGAFNFATDSLQEIQISLQFRDTNYNQATMIVDQIELVTVPEPSLAAALAGMSMLLWVVRRNRRT